MVIRTYDLGGEKGIGPAPGENPALGLRGLRYCLAHPELFVEQLTALCLASRKGKLRILLPMVTSLSELKAARRLLEKAASRSGLSEAPALGVMVEVPSAALMADRLAAEADFFSIGTNDLTQYGLAVDRANPDVSALYRPLHPAILRMIRLVVEAGAAHGRPVAVCGELAADPIGVAVLVGLGIGDLSVTPVAIPEVKEILCSIDAGRVAGARAAGARRWTKRPKSKSFSEETHETRPQALGPRGDLRRERALRRERSSTFRPATVSRCSTMKERTRRSTFWKAR